MKRLLRWVEVLLWCAAVLLLGAYAWVYLDRTVYQAYRDWAFDRALGHEPAPVLGFVLHALRFGGRGSGELGEYTPPPPPAPKPPELAPPPRQVQPELSDEAVVGRIEIPRIGLRAILLEGTSKTCLRRAVGHIEGTALPGEPGNAAFAGHRDTFFYPLKSIRKDDVIRIQTLDGTFTYRVDSVSIVAPDATEVLKPTATPTLTLVTCYPFNYIGPAPSRYIVQASETSAAWGDGSLER